MIINLNDEIKQIAIKHSVERMNYEYDRFKLNFEQRKSMIILGTLGQLAFKQFLNDKKIQFQYEFQAGKYDDLDFKLENDIIEIKTSGYENDYLHLNLLYSESQFKRGLLKKFKYCIIIFINGYNKLNKMMDLNKCNQAVIYGYIEFNDIKNFKQDKKYYGDDYKVPLSSLKNINELIDKYRNG